jgi:hypothetical protein
MTPRERELSDQILKLTEERNTLRTALKELLEKWRGLLHTFDGKPMRDYPDHARYCSECRHTLRAITDLSATLATGEDQ